ETAPAVRVILWRLDEADCGIREARYQGLQPVRMDHIIGIDDADDLSLMSRVRGRHAQRARLEAEEVLHADELETAAEVQAAGSDRLPKRRVWRVVDDHDALEIRVIKPGHGIERLQQHLRRLAVRGNMDRHFGGEEL